MIFSFSIVEITLVDGSTPITLDIPNSRKGFNSIPSLQPISNTLEVSGIKNSSVTSFA